MEAIFRHFSSEESALFAGGVLPHIPRPGRVLGVVGFIVAVVVVEKLPELLAFIEQQMEEVGCPLKTQMEIAVAAEEVFVNIASYAYAPGTGIATVCIEIDDDPPVATIAFSDSGVPFDPLKKADPDVTLPAEEREIGGLGIFMTRKFMDDVTYTYRDGQNILTLKKNL